MAGPIYPDVPASEGVPPVKRGTDSLGGGTTDAISSDSITVTANRGNKWGIYTAGGKLALEADTIVAVGFDGEYRIADFPIEEGGFESYDKVALPFETRVVMTKGGDRAARQEFLTALDDLRSDLKLYNVVTPERTYLNVNVARVSLDRTREQGAGLVTIEVRLREIRQNATASFSKTKEPASADTVNNGAAQATPSATGTDGVK
ncbi:MAG: hypothetical protein KGM49_00640 [Sphingomonadales bacterium]|nr:hypothetical protein [Sphingomonadales bacterium]